MVKADHMTTPAASLSSDILNSGQMLGLSFFAAFLLLIQHGKGQNPTNLPSNGVQLYLPYEDKIIPNYSMIVASQFYNIDENNDPDNTNDALWCQSANTASNIGVWYYPNGTEVPLFDGNFDSESAPSPVFAKRYNGQIALARKLNIAGVEGLYKCVIPDENEVYQTLVVGAYRTSTYNKNDGPDVDPYMQFSLLSTSRLAIPSVFSLSFNAYDSPPTTINCTVNGNGISTDELSRVVMNAFVTKVTVTLRSREAGNYQCTVSNERVSAGTINGITAMANTSSLYINVSGTPTDLKTIRLNTGLAHMRLLWSSVLGAAGYEVFCEHLNNKSISNTTTPSVTITSGLSLSTTYTFYVISYSNEASLPSNANIATFNLTHPSVNDLSLIGINSTTIVLSWSPPTVVTPASYNICRRCRRICGSVETYTNFTVSDPRHSSPGILPYSNCTFDLVGLYGNEEYILIRNFSATTSASGPTSPVGNIIFSSVKAESMDVSWDEVPCSGRNGPITGYSLTYASITPNISFSVNITGGDNRTHTLTGLLPYTYYNVSISPYNYGLLGPANELSHRTAQSIPGVISNLIQTGINIQFINISWNPPVISNGLITVYEIRYREHNDTTKPYATVNTTATQNSIGGLFPNTNYTIGVRAYTVIGPGQWVNTVLSTDEISVVHNFSVTYLNSTTVNVKWLPNGASYYSVFYYASNCEARFDKYPSDIREVAIGGLCSCLENIFSISAIFEISGKIFEGEKSPPILPVKFNSSSTTIEATATFITQFTPTPTAVSETNGTMMTTIGLWVALILLLISLIINIVLMLLLILLCRRLVTTDSRKGVAATMYPEIRECRETDDYIEMKASPAYDRNLSIEPVYESTDEIIYETTR